MNRLLSVRTLLFLRHNRKADYGEHARVARTQRQPKRVEVWLRSTILRPDRGWGSQRPDCQSGVGRAQPNYGTKKAKASNPFVVRDRSGKKTVPVTAAKVRRRTTPLRKGKDQYGGKSYRAVEQKQEPTHAELTAAGFP